MIKYLKHTEIDKTKWDDCLSQSFNGIIYAYSWFLDIVCPYWEGLVEGDYEFIMPLTKGRKYGINYLFPPYFTQQLGVFSKKIVSESKVVEFLNTIPADIKFIEINLNVHNNISSSSISTKQNLTHELSLQNSYETIFNSYYGNTKRNLKKAEKNNLIVSGNILPEDVIKMFRENKGKEVSNLKSKQYKILNALIKECASRNKLESIGITTPDGKLCAGGFFVESNGKWIFIFSCSTKETKSKGAMFLLIDSFIKKHSNRNQVLDFEGSNNKNLAQFYKCFGSKENVYLQVKINKLPALIRWFKK